MVVADGDGRIQGFQEKPDPAEALSDLANCMHLHVPPRDLRLLPEPGEQGGRPRRSRRLRRLHGRLPGLLEHDVPFYSHEIDSYWNDVGTLREYVQGNLDALRRGRDRSGRGEVSDGVRSGQPA